MAGGLLMYDILQANGLSALDITGLVMFTALFTWISGAFWTAIAGFVVRLVGRDPAVLRPVRAAAVQGRTAIVTPIYNEDTARVFARVETIWSLAAAAARPRNISTTSFSPIRAGPTSRAPKRSSPGKRWWRGSGAAADCFIGAALITSGASPAISPSSCAIGAARTIT